MLHVFEEIFGHFVRRFIGDVEFLFGFLVAFGFWSFDYAVWEVRDRRYAMSAACAVIGVALVGFALLAARDAGALFRISLAGLLLYIPLRIATAKLRGRHRSR